MTESTGAGQTPRFGRATWNQAALAGGMLVILLWAAQPALATAGSSRADERFFNGRDLTGWSGPEMKYWSVEDGAIVGRSDKPVPRNEFLWSEAEVGDFYLALDVKLEPNEANAGIQFRSQKLPPHEALGYQADAGKGVWGRLYHESGRKKLDWRNRGEAAVKPGEWNRYEILAVGDRVWTAINGKLAVSVRDPRGERKGFIALQVHSGPPQTVRYKIHRLVHDPKVELAGLDERQLDAALVPPEDATAPATGPTPRTAPAVPLTRPSTRPAGVVPATQSSVERFGDAPKPPAAPLPAFIGEKFDVAPNEVIIFAGQTNMVRAEQSGDLEARLAVHFADRRPRFRSMAWEGDTVYQQWRDLNFGGWRSQLAWAGATMLIVQFGQTEALDGPKRLDAFTEAYARLLDEWCATTKRIVVVSPMQFEKPDGPLMPDQTVRNGDVRTYADAARKLAAERGLVFVDLFAELASRTPGQRLTSNGLHLTAAGHRVVGRIIASQLGAASVPDEQLEPVCRSIVAKNQLWFDNWRPMNWAFAYGDRQKVPFGQPGGGQPALRVELEEFKPLVVQADAAIHDVATRVKAKPGE